jgi:hypothetical protein
MSIFSELGDAFFGGAEKKAAKEEQKALADAALALGGGTATARGEAKALYGGAIDQTQQGFQKALDLWNQIGLRGSRTMQEANTAGQRQMLSGLKEAHANLLGVPMNYSELQANPPYRDFQFWPQMPPAMDPRTDLVDPVTGLDFDLANLPFEANNIMGMLAEGRLTTEQAHNMLSTGQGYGSFDGLPKSIVERLLAPYQAGGALYSRQTDPKFANELGGVLASLGG